MEEPEYEPEIDVEDQHAVLMESFDERAQRYGVRTTQLNEGLIAYSKEARKWIVGFAVAMMLLVLRGGEVVDDVSGEIRAIVLGLTFAALLFEALFLFATITAWQDLRDATAHVYHLLNDVRDDAKMAWIEKKADRLEGKVEQSEKEADKTTSLLQKTLFLPEWAKHYRTSSLVCLGLATVLLGCCLMNVLWNT